MANIRPQILTLFWANTDCLPLKPVLGADARSGYNVSILLYYKFRAIQTAVFFVWFLYYFGLRNHRQNVPQT